MVKIMLRVLESNSFEGALKKLKDAEEKERRNLGNLPRVGSLSVVFASSVTHFPGTSLRVSQVGRVSAMVQVNTRLCLQL